MYHQYPGHSGSKKLPCWSAYPLGLNDILLCCNTSLYNTIPLPHCQFTSLYSTLLQYMAWKNVKRLSVSKDFYSCNFSFSIPCNIHIDFLTDCMMCHYYPGHSGSLRSYHVRNYGHIVCLSLFLLCYNEWRTHADCSFTWLLHSQWSNSAGYG